MSFSFFARAAMTACALAAVVGAAPVTTAPSDLSIASQSTALQTSEIPPHSIPTPYGSNSLPKPKGKIRVGREAKRKAKTRTKRPSREMLFKSSWTMGEDTSETKDKEAAEATATESEDNIVDRIRPEELLHPGVDITADTLFNERFMCSSTGEAGFIKCPEEPVGGPIVFPMINEALNDDIRVHLSASTEQSVNRTKHELQDDGEHEDTDLEERIIGPLRLPTSPVVPKPASTTPRQKKVNEAARTHFHWSKTEKGSSEPLVPRDGVIEKTRFHWCDTEKGSAPPSTPRQCSAEEDEAIEKIKIVHYSESESGEASRQHLPVIWHPKEEKLDEATNTLLHTSNISNEFEEPLGTEELGTAEDGAVEKRIIPCNLVAKINEDEDGAIEKKKLDRYSDGESGEAPRQLLPLFCDLEDEKLFKAVDAVSHTSNTQKESAEALNPEEEGADEDRVVEERLIHCNLAAEINGEVLC